MKNQLHDWQVKPLFGLLPKQKWPDEGMPGRYVGGVRVWVNSKTVAKLRKQFIRVRCACPECDEPDLPFGRLAQHMKSHRA